MNAVLREITPITEKDCLYIVERHKSEFLYPLHSHMEFELNFIENGAGVKRVIGDSVEEIGEYELTLVAGSNWSTPGSRASVRRRMCGKSPSSLRRTCLTAPA